MKITREEVLKIAHISRIAVHEDEMESLIQQLNDILTYAQRVQQLAKDIDDSNTLQSPYEPLMREDRAHVFNAQEIVKRSPEHEQNYFVVPKILDVK